MATKHITLIVTGSIAAVKCYDLIQSLQQKDMMVSVILTDMAQQWVTKEAASQLTSATIMTSTDWQSHGDALEQLFAGSDIILVAPASADSIKQLKYHDTPLSQAMLKSGKPIVVAPAMNVMMWQHPAVQRNVKALLAQQIRFLGPADGSMACGDSGFGRFMEPAIISDAIAAMLAWDNHEAFAQIDIALISNPSLPAIDSTLASALQKRILLVIHGASDALSSYSLISTLRTRGYQLHCVLTEEAQHLLPAQGLSGMAGEPVYTHHYQNDVQGMEHIRLPEQADLVLIHPATAIGVKEMVQGGAHSFAGCIYLASKKPVILVPSGDPSQQPAADDLERLKHDGVQIMTIDAALHPASKEHAIAVADALESIIHPGMTVRKHHA
jgi:phosphopantothenoylcysteine synthetase/decarboxylase